MASAHRSRDAARRVLVERFGHEEFQEGQWESIEALLAGRDALVVMPTGSGKSLVYQLPALMLPGLTVIVSPLIAVEKVRFGTLDEFFAINAESDRAFAYTVAWIDSLARGKNLARGLFIRGNHATEASATARRPLTLSVPIDMPSFLLNGLTMRLFNEAYYGLQRGRSVRTLSHYEPFFYPLDAVRHWNRIYGARGFLQYQCVVPFSDGGEAIREILGRIARSGLGSFLSVLKTFGDKPSPGLLSFPRPLSSLPGGRDT